MTDGFIDNLMVALADGRPRAVFNCDGELRMMQVSKRSETMVRDYPQWLVGVYNARATRQMIIEDIEYYG
jgi:hypothetical protein